MLIIRNEQMDALGREAVRRFTQRMVEHLNEIFPDGCARAGPERVLQVISQGLAQAAGYGIVNELDVARYIDLSVVLGLDFDTSGRYPWAATILNEPESTAEEKMLSLLLRTQSLRDQGPQPRVIGPNVRR